MTLHYPTTKIPIDNKARLFLAGSIEMGSAENWQQKVIDKIDPYFNIFNPRRPDWDLSWDENSQELKNQINWELDNILNADIIIFYFDPKTKSPITLLELGLVLNSRIPAIVCCPEGYFRRTNVIVTCERYGQEVLGSLEEVIERVKSYEPSTTT